MPDIVHFTTVHSRLDTRIVVKELATLSKSLHQTVALYVQDGLGDETNEKYGFTIHDTGPRSKGRWSRMLLGGWRMYRAVRRANPKIAHFHDPELIPFAALLRLSGIKVIYDAHEDIELQVLHKPYLPSWSRRPLSWILAITEGLAMQWFDGTVAVLEHLVRKRPGKNKITVTNFPDLSEFDELLRGAASTRERRFVYLGGITRPRGALEMVEAIGHVRSADATLALVGQFDTEALAVKARADKGWERVDFKGWSSRETVLAECARACAGVVVLHPTPQYVTWYPVKMFEYLAAGLPVIASDFPLWAKLFAEFKCGLNVDPYDPKAIAQAMDWILANPEESAAMGQRGRAAVEAVYNWQPEAEKLVGLYRKLLASPSREYSSP
jgi:glycosyltransferase involved in cell wall biosynthesis